MNYNTDRRPLPFLQLIANTLKSYSQPQSFPVKIGRGKSAEKVNVAAVITETSGGERLQIIANGKLAVQLTLDGALEFTGDVTKYARNTEIGRQTLRALANMQANAAIKF